MLRIYNLGLPVTLPRWEIRTFQIEFYGLISAQFSLINNNASLCGMFSNMMDTSVVECCILHPPCYEIGRRFESVFLCKNALSLVDKFRRHCFHPKQILNRKAANSVQTGYREEARKNSFALEKFLNLLFLHTQNCASLSLHFSWFFSVLPNDFRGRA
jgi:hypothetical protein